MTWLNPAAFAFLGSIPILLLLHSLRYRRRDVQVSTLFLWERVAREAHGSLGLRRLIQNLPLVLQLLLALLLTLALANPVLTETATHSKDIILVLDTSASMQTRTPQGTRFAEAQQRALEVLQTLPSGRQMALIAAGRQPRVVSFFTDEKALLRQDIMRLQATDAPGNMREAILLALSFTQGRQTQEVVVIGDGAYRGVAALDFPRGQIRHMRVAGGEGNVGITRFAFRKVPESEPARFEVLIAVKNFSSRERLVPLTVTVRQQQVLTREVTLPAGQEEVVVAALDGPLRGVAEAAIDVDDALLLDNRAYSVLAPPAQTWLLLVGESNYFLEQLLTSVPGVQVNVAPEVSEAALPRLLEANHLLVFNGVQPPPLRQGNFLLLHTTPQDERIGVAGRVTAPQVVDWDRKHPLLEFVDLTDLRIEESLALRPQRGARSLVDGPGISLMSVIEEPSLRVVTLGFDLMRSDLPLRVAFPVFISNVLRWSHPETQEAVAGQIRAGMPYVLFFERPVQQVTVQNPRGQERVYEVQGNPWMFTEAEQVGVYILRYGDEKRYVTVSLLDEAESDIHPAEALPELRPAPDGSGPQQAGIVETPLWPYLLLGAVLVLLGEWYVWCRDS
jgi:hypothetical protein